jgi:serine/threonine-protein kinase
MPHRPEQDTISGRRPRTKSDPLIGTLLDDRFLIEARIAIGGFGAIYRARTADGAEVALKILHPRLTGDPSMVARFRREGAIMTQLHDPNTVKTLAVGETGDGTRYIAMELLAGENLHARLSRDGTLPWPTAVAIARAVCSSLAEAHALGVVHRDLKPENIHVEARGDGPDIVKVIDFGIVKIAHGSAIDDGKDLTFAGHMIGTYDYMSPEQIVGSPCSDLSDIYSLGVVTYEMLTGRRPFPEAQSAAAMMAALLTQTPPPPSLVAAIPPELDRIVMRCLAREPEDRFRDVVALAGAFDRLLADCPAPQDDVTAERPACVPEPAIADEDRTWIDLESTTLPGVDRATLSEHARTHTMPAVEVDDLASVTRRARQIASGTGPLTRFPPGLLAPRAAIAPQGALPEGLYTTLPGVAVATKPRPARETRHLLSDPPAPHTLAPLGWQATPHAQPQIPPPSIPIGRLAVLADPRPPARSYAVLWVALVIGCLTALITTAIL